jgi:hypothetical protein
VWDRFKTIIADHKKADSENRAASGISEDCSTKKELLQEMRYVTSMSKKERIAWIGEMPRIDYGKPEITQISRTPKERRRKTSPGNETFLNITEGEKSEIDGMSRSDYEMIHHAEEALRRCRAKHAHVSRTEYSTPNFIDEA